MAPLSANEQMRLLVVEDDPVNERVARAILEALGYAVDVARDGVEAVAAVLAKPYAAVLMDGQMPGLDGYQATAEIRRREAGGRRTVILGMTASAGSGAAERALASGMDGYIAKPLRTKELREFLALHVPQASISSSPSPFSRSSEEEAPPYKPSRRVVELFTRQLAGRMADISAAIGRGDTTALRGESHKLRGACAALGLEQLTRVCGEIESAAERGDLSLASAGVGELGPLLASEALRLTREADS